MVGCVTKRFFLIIPSFSISLLFHIPNNTSNPLTLISIFSHSFSPNFFAEPNIASESGLGFYGTLLFDCQAETD